MARSDTPNLSARPVRAEVPPANYWQRWSVANAAPAAAVQAHITDTAAGAAMSAAVQAPGLQAANEAPYRVLIVEDDRSQALFAQSVLHGAGMQAIMQLDAEGVQQAIDTHRPDLILMDLHMPGLDGMRLTTLIRQQPQQQLLPIVFLTGDSDPERQFEVLDSGADDFLTKPIRPRHLVAAVSNRIRRSRQQALGLVGNSAAPAMNNPETGLPTRHNLMLQLDAALATREAGGLMFIEIASALGLRERYGYAAFERLMVQAGRRLNEAARPHPLARLSDNSFLLLARDIDENTLEALALVLRQALSAHPFLVREDESVHLRCAIGYARLSQGFEDGGSAVEAVERTALQARLLADGVAAHQSAADAAAQEHMALLDGHLELAYQPIVAVAGSDTAQYQVLLRMRRSDGALLSAGQVIPAAEAAGRIADLDQQVLEHALGLLHRYQFATPPMRLFVSQSLRTLARDVFAEWLLKAIAERGIPGNSLVIDVRLADALVHAVTLQQFCGRLMSAGVQFCLSQFEPGAEANALLTQLPLSFVRMAGRYAGSHTDQKLRDELRGVIDDAHRANLQVIGQQIEDPQAAAAMWMGGVDFIQGNVVQSVGSELDFDFQKRGVVSTPTSGRWALGATLLAAAAAALPWLPGTAMPPLATAAAVCAALCALMSSLAARSQAQATEEQARRAHNAERELHQLRQEQQRHAQLEQQLLQAKQDAEAAMLAKGEFLATMSHEIRTPLNGIIPMLEMVARGPLAVEQRQMLDTASESAHALFRIVDDILDYSKLEAQRLELEITTFNLRELLDSMLQLMRRSAEHKGLDVTLHLDPAVRLAVRGDPVRLRQVLSNLLVNAIKFTERGGIQIHVRRLGETPTQHQLRFEVRDTGIGIDGNRQERLFSAFTQADASTTRLYGGTGLGLAICKRIIDLMKGSIGLSSVPGQGSTFWFEIPLLKVVGDLRQPGPSQHGQQPVLLVTREPRLRQRLQLLLPNWGLQPRAVETVQEALDLLREPAARCHAIIADLDSLPHGTTALQRTAQRDGQDGLRLVWLHGDAPVPAELHDGAIMLPRQCTDADLRAALTSTPTASAHVTTAPAAPEPLAEWSPADVCVLLVEDNPVNLLVAQKLLAAIGCQTESAANGELALEKMRAHRYAAVLMDCQMPVLDGYAATRRWREHEAATGTVRLPIIAMTANAMAGDRQRCLDAGMDDYLSKPIVRDNLQACLQRWCQTAMPPKPASAPLLPPHAQAAPPPPPSSGEIAQNATPPVLDREVLDELREIAGNETANIIDVFLDDTAPLVRRLQEAAVAPDLDQLRELAHSLKSASANVGAMALSAAARRVELAARSGLLDRPAVMVALIIAEFARARFALIGYQAEMRAGTGAQG